LSESYIKAEIVRPKWTGEEWAANIAGGLLGLALRTLIVWWLFATWFPQLGLTYWQLALPVYAIRTVLANAPFGRQLK
jgi:hypothetical protein